MYWSVVVARATHVDTVYYKKRILMSPPISCVHGIDAALLYDTVLSVGASTAVVATWQGGWEGIMAVLARTLRVE